VLKRCPVTQSMQGVHQTRSSRKPSFSGSVAHTVAVGDFVLDFLGNA
jgi:hypothetical protein